MKLSRSPLSLETDRVERRSAVTLDRSEQRLKHSLDRVAATREMVYLSGVLLERLRART